MNAHSTELAAKALIMELRGNPDATRADLHNISEKLYPSHTDHTRREFVRVAWAKLHPPKKKARPARRKGPVAGNQKQLDPMPDGMRGPLGLTTSQRDRFRAWLIEYIRENPEIDIREVRNLLADRTGVWYGDVEAFARNYVNPARERLGLDIVYVTNIARDPFSTAGMKATGNSIDSIELLSSDVAGFVRVSIELEVPKPLGMRIIHAVTGTVIPNEKAEP